MDALVDEGSTTEMQKGIQLEALHIVNNAFDECARAQQSLQQLVNTSIMDIFRRHHHGLSLGTLSASSDCLHVNDFCGTPAAQEAPSLQDNQHLVSKSWQSSDRITGYVPTSLGIRNASECDTTSAGVFSSHALTPKLVSGPRGPPLMRTEPRQPNSSNWSSIEVDELWHAVDGPQHSIIMEAEQSAAGVTAKGETRMYLATLGVFVSASTYADLPRWHRLAEKILNSQSDLVSKLAGVWLKGIYRTKVASIVDSIMLRAKFLLNLEKATRQVNKIDAKYSRHKAQNMAAITALVGRLALRSFPLHPGGGARLFWDSLSLIICLYDVIILPMLVFEFDSEARKYTDGVEFYGAMFWTMDILMSFCTAYFDGHILQRGFHIIAASYIRSWFFLDFAIVVNDWLAVIANRGSFRALRIVKFIKTIIRGVRLIRILKLSEHYRMALQRMNSEIALSTVKIGTQAFSVAVMCHYVGCGWYALHVLASSESTWVIEYISPDATTLYRYSTSLQWALTQFLPASIKVQPVNTPERIYNTVIILIAMVVFSSFVSSITVSMNHLRACRLSAIERELQLRRFLAENHMSKELSYTIWSCIKKSNRQRRFATKPDKVLALNCLPEHILELVYNDMFAWQLRRHPLFEFYSIIEPKCMAKLCRTGIDIHSMLAGDILWHDLVLNGMLFVRRGVLIYSMESKHEQSIVEPGEWCCEEALWSEAPRIDAPFSAGEPGCDLLIVSPIAFQTVAIKFPQDVTSFRFLARYGEEFTRSFNEASHKFESKNLLFNDRHTCLDIVNDAAHFFQVPADEDEDV